MTKALRSIIKALKAGGTPAWIGLVAIAAIGLAAFAIYASLLATCRR